MKSIIVKRLLTSILGALAISFLGQAYQVPTVFVLSACAAYGFFVPSALFPLSDANEQNNSN